MFLTAAMNDAPERYLIRNTARRAPLLVPRRIGGSPGSAARCKLCALLALVLREDDRLLAGLFAEIVWNALHIDLLWVAADHRRHGYGRSLVQRAEEFSRERACDVAYLSTFDFQAPPFYGSMGYSVIGELVGAPRGSRRLWFGKALTKEGNLLRTS